MPVWRRIAADREGVVATPWPCTSEQDTQHNNDVAPQAYYVISSLIYKSGERALRSLFWQCWIS